jgi:hypothetical protein
MDLDDDTDRDALVTMVSGCDLLDGIRHGITSHGWTLPEHQIRQLPGSSR